MAHEFVDWLKELKVVDEGHILEMPPNTEPPSIKDAEATVIGDIIPLSPWNLMSRARGWRFPKGSIC